MRLPLARSLSCTIWKKSKNLSCVPGMSVAAKPASSSNGSQTSISSEEALVGTA